MIKILISKQSGFAVSSPVIKKKLANFLAKQGIVSDSEVSVAIVGEKKMMEIGATYLKDKKLHNVLSFTPGEENFTDKTSSFAYPNDKTIYLGEIIVCYPEAVREANASGKLIDERVYELIEHGSLHLLGVHHDEL